MLLLTLLSVTLVSAFTGPATTKPGLLALGNSRLQGQFGDLHSQIQSLARLTTTGEDQSSVVNEIKVTLDQLQQTINYAAVGSRRTQEGTMVKRAQYAVPADISRLLALVMQSTNDLETLVNSTQPLLDMVANHGNGWQRPIATIVSLTFPAAENVKPSKMMRALLGRIPGQKGLIGLKCLVTDVLASSPSYEALGAKFDNFDSNLCPKPSPTDPVEEIPAAALDLMMTPIVANSTSPPAPSPPVVLTPLPVVPAPAA